ncbi:hypothetical protein COX26_00205 [Candidatus Jorgensenbacteria bacterium CG23_combo_of_CG06-09_8_20_14_all_54_14]|uniref:Bacterial Ig-like domain-containing protein n=1 Tax=Candidatus Jorgensenbacteria bacterium CG23_combo_of_CG06-09_8_20_14_all_54_14 TaxID=1974595 RepID=A0A2G9ZAG8_9BACT|nr:MAG: hypothetical protein COX26_00205 [Candidatus Jorgensenbacteria bacterium CG23_combo_of_CG06-09_8_20_14_all_54_14]
MKKFLPVIVIAIAIVVALAGNAYSATQPPLPAQAGAPAQLILTWSANNFYPSDYEGKALPAGGATVNASLEVAQGGKLQDVKNVPITWYLDSEYFVRGAGLKHTTFTVTKRKGDAHSLRTVANLPGGDSEATAIVPVVNREVVIETPYRGVSAPHGKPLVFRAVPYFFNIASLAELTFSWTAGGDTQSASGDNELSVNLDNVQNRGTFPVSVGVRAFRSPLESASDAITITINP